MAYYVGIDWSERLQDWAVTDDTGTKVKHGKFPLTSDGLKGFLTAVEQYRDPATGDLPRVAIETGTGVVVAELTEAGLPVHAINPLKIRRFREATQIGGGKSDRADAFTIAEALRVNLRNHPPLPRLSHQSLSLQRVARAHQDAVWRSLRQTNEIRSLLQESWPAANAVFTPGQLTRPEILAVLRAWPTAAHASTMTPDALRSVLRGAGRTRYLDRDVDAWHGPLTAPALAVPAGVADAYGEHLQALLDLLAASAEVERVLHGQVLERLAAHPLNALVQTVPCLGGVTAARLLGELGDDPARFATASNARAFAGTAPLTKASSTSSSVKRRHIKNNRANSAAFLWAFAGLRYNQGIRAAYDRRRTGRAPDGRPYKDKHAAALRNVGNRLVGCLWHCIATGEPWDDKKVWGQVIDTRPQWATDTTPPLLAARGPAPVSADSASSKDQADRIDAEAAVEALLAG